MFWLCDFSSYLALDSSKERHHVNDSYRSPLEDTVFPRTKSAPSLAKVLPSHHKSNSIYDSQNIFSNQQIMHISAVLYSFSFLIDTTHTACTVSAIQFFQTSKGNYIFFWKIGSFEKSGVKSQCSTERVGNWLLVWVIMKIERIRNLWLEDSSECAL